MDDYMREKNRHPRIGGRKELRIFFICSGLPQAARCGVMLG